MKPLVIYHANCADGFGAAFAAWMKLGDEAEYLPMQYGYDLLPDFKDREIYMLDFSWKREHMEDLFCAAKSVAWLDHHKSAFDMWLGEGFLFTWQQFYQSRSDGFVHDITLDNNKSGAMLAWEYFHPGVEVPMLIRHIDDRDRWQFKLPGSKEVNAVLWSRTPWSFAQWRVFIEEKGGSLEWAKLEGAAILRAHEQNVAAVVAGAWRKCRIIRTEPKENGEHWEVDILIDAVGLAANCPPHLQSDVGHSLATTSGTYGLLWYINKDGKCLCSLRSNGDYDVSAIAKAFGGGGHKNAAGFETSIQVLLEWIRG